MSLKNKATISLSLEQRQLAWLAQASRVRDLNQSAVIRSLIDKEITREEKKRVSEPVTTLAD